MVLVLHAVLVAKEQSGAHIVTFGVHFMRDVRIVSAIVGCLSLLCVNSALADKLTLSAGMEYSRGDYGDPVSTDVFYEYVSAKYWSGPWAVKLSIPFVQVDGAGTIVDDGSEFDAGGEDRMVGGVSDVSLTIQRNFSWKDEGLYLDLFAKARLPTGDRDRGLGSGEVDYTAAAQLTKAIGDFEVYVYGGRRFLSDTDEFERRDGWILSAGASAEVSESVEVGAFFDWREAAVEEASAPMELGLELTGKISDDVKLSVSGSVGLNENSPDYSVGVSLSWKVFQD
jgi:hypothetical protein